MPNFYAKTPFCLRCWEVSENRVRRKNPFGRHISLDSETLKRINFNHWCLIFLLKDHGKHKKISFTDFKFEVDLHPFYWKKFMSCDIVCSPRPSSPSLSLQTNKQKLVCMFLKVSVDVDKTSRSRVQWSCHFQQAGTRSNRASVSDEELITWQLESAHTNSMFYFRIKPTTMIVKAWAV